MVAIFGFAARILFVVFFFGLCIFIHELGHLLVALWCKLHVEKFSIGFGKKIWGTTRNGVEYVISAFPFGGYVALPQLDPTDEPVTQDGTPLPHASPQSRIATAFAGPFSNVILGFALATIVMIIGVDKPAPARFCDVIAVPEDTPEYNAGLRPGDRVIAVNGEELERGWEDLSKKIMLSNGRVSLAVVRNDETLTFSYEPDANPAQEGLAYPFFEVSTPIVVHKVLPGTPAEEAGIQSRDRVVAMNGQPFHNTIAFSESVAASEGKPLELVVVRDGQEVTITGLAARPEETQDGNTIYRIGVAFGVYERVHPNPWAQFVGVFTQTRDTLRALFAPKSKVKIRHLSGPVGIAQIIWIRVALGGYRDGLSFIVLITFSLAFVNLLPIPVLDGGHIVYALIEIVSRRKIPTKVAYGVQMAFAVLIIAFMLYVTIFDVLRTKRLWNVYHPDETPTEEIQADQPPAESADNAADEQEKE